MAPLAAPGLRMRRLRYRRRPIDYNRTGPTPTRELTPPPTKPLATPPGVDVLVATVVDGFDHVADALVAATEQWGSAAPETYAYRVRIDCECVDQGTTWVRVFDPDWAR